MYKVLEFKEGKHYYVTRFKVTENIGDYKPTKHNHKIIFLKSFVIRKCNDITIPTERFNFANFNDILALKYDTTVLTDISIYSYVSKPENNKSFVIIIPYAKVKLYRGNYYLKTNCF